MSTYLQLTPEFGGTRFGPFPQGMIQIGSDPGRCQIVLNANLGVFAVHCILQDAGNGRYTLAPTQSNLPLHIVQKGETKAWPVTGAVQAKPGDIIVVGPESGPRFEIQQDVGAAASAGKELAAGAGAIGGALGGLMGGMAGQRSKQKGYGGRLASEAGRQARSRLMMRNPFFRTIYNVFFRLKSGSWKSPYFVVSVISTVIGAIFAGGVSCSGLAWALYHQFLYGR